MLLLCNEIWQEPRLRLMKDHYETLGVEWRKIGLSTPAVRALVDAKLYKVSDLRKISLADLSSMHGLGKSAVARIRQIMDAKKIRFAD